MTRIIEAREALELLARAVKEKGADYVYPNVGNGCTYVRDGLPSCIVGHVVNYIDPEIIPVIGEWESNGVEYKLDEGDNRIYPEVTHLAEGNFGDSSADELNEALIRDPDVSFQFSRQAVRVLRVAQLNQDNGCQWGDALDSARVTYQQFKTNNKEEK